MKLLNAWVLVGCLCASAAADEYSSKGQLEIGGTVEAGSSTASSNGVNTTTTTFKLKPQLGYFVRPRLAIIGGLMIDHTGTTATFGGRSQDSHSRAIALVGGAGYYFPAGRVFIGPEGVIGFLNESQTNASGSGLLMALRGALKIPIGTMALANIGATLSYSSVSLDSNGRSSDVSTTGIALDFGFSVFF